jgi:hypothetical protein
MIILFRSPVILSRVMRPEVPPVKRLKRCDPAEVNSCPLPDKFAQFILTVGHLPPEKVIGLLVIVVEHLREDMFLSVVLQKASGFPVIHNVAFFSVRSVSGVAGSAAGIDYFPGRGCNRLPCTFSNSSVAPPQHFE